MKFYVNLVFIFAVFIHTSSAQTVWRKSQGTLTFSKAGFADWTKAENQDRISDSIWITRANSQNLFNIRKENAATNNSPSGTLWAFGTTDSFVTLSYKTFLGLSGGSSQALVGKDLVLYLVTENIYLDIKILTYGNTTAGSPFSYIRATKITNVETEKNSLPSNFELLQNYPNPFNPTTTIKYTVGTNARSSPNNTHGWASVPTQVLLKIYDALGREVATLVNEMKEPGNYSVQFNANNLPSGVYFAKLQYGEKIQIKKIMLMK